MSTPTQAPAHLADSCLWGAAQTLPLEGLPLPDPGWSLHQNSPGARGCALAHQALVPKIAQDQS